VIDILPTLADVSNSSIPVSWPGRDLSPIAGVSLAPTFGGESLSERAIYFLMHRCRGIRQGDWKLVSFRGHAWELYNMKRDRTEICDLVDEHPDVALRLADLWYEMASRVDEAPLETRSVLSPTELEKLHPLWTDFAEEEIKSFSSTGRVNVIEKHTNEMVCPSE
jgi:arylsulfatase